MRRPAARGLVLALLLPGCGPGVVSPAEGETGSPPSDTTIVSASAADQSTTTEVGSSPGSSTASFPPVTSAGFLGESDLSDGIYECDFFTQTCPPGLKCSPAAVNGSNTWNGMRCVPLSPEPAQVGEACVVEGEVTSGADDCALGAFCWNLDLDTNAGTCVALCTGSSTHPTCDDPQTDCAFGAEGTLYLCLPICDPLAQDCRPGDACYPIDDSFQCIVDDSAGAGAHGDPCEFINVCDPGLVCLGSRYVPGCMAPIGCCSELCDLLAPSCPGMAEGQTCLPWYEEGQAPPRYEDVGVCALPS